MKYLGTVSLFNIFQRTPVVYKPAKRHQRESFTQIKPSVLLLTFNSLLIWPTVAWNKSILDANMGQLESFFKVPTHLPFLDFLLHEGVFTTPVTNLLSGGHPQPYCHKLFSSEEQIRKESRERRNETKYQFLR
jgi:hypothetical protein